MEKAIFFAAIHTHVKSSHHLLINPFVKIVVLLLLLITPTAVGDDAATMVNPVQLEKFVDELPIVPKLYGYGVFNGRPVPASLQIGMFYKKWKFHRDLPPTPVFAYGTSQRTATVPGPTIEALQGIETNVTWLNYLPKEHILPWDRTIPVAIPTTGIPTVPHLHGGLIEPGSDGNAKAWFTAGFREKGLNWEKETYHYLNYQQPGNLWYHDHALGLTRVNLLAGLVGAYVIRQPGVELPLRLPSGDEFDRTLVIFDRDFLTNGSIYMNPVGDNPSIHPEWEPEYFGGVIVVNGKAWPKMTVQRRKYRFRIINTSNARFYRFNLSNNLPFTHLSSDSAYLSKPVMTRKFLLAPSEIADVIVDFSTSPSDSAILFNDAPFPYPTGDPVEPQSNALVMKFIILPSQYPDESRIPPELLQYPSPDLSAVAKKRYIALYEYESGTGEPTHLLINAMTLDDPVTEIPKVGTSEVWYVINLTEDNHPVHIHLGLFRVLDQTELTGLDEFKSCMNKSNDAVACKIDDHTRGGSHVPVPAQESGWKNVFKMQPGFVTTIYVRFSYIHTDQEYRFDSTAEPGYVYHCHILDHEDNVMMRPFKLIN